MSVFDGSLTRHVGIRLGILVSDHACQSPMASDKAYQFPKGLQSSMSVSDEAGWWQIRHVSLRWSLMRHIGGQLGMSVSDQHVGLRGVSDQTCRSLMGLR